MKKILLSLLTLVALNVNAQEVVLDFADGAKTWGLANGKDSENLVTSGTFTNGTYTIKISGAENGVYYFSDNKSLLMGKSGATLELPAFSFAVGKIEVVGAASASKSVTQNIYVGDKAVSTSVTGAKETASFTIDKDYQAANTVFKIKVTNSNNTQITKINIYKATGSEKSAAGISYSKQTFYYSIDLDTELPTLSNPNNVSVTYSSSNTAVATVNSSTGEITPLKAGETTITATSEASDKYEAGTATVKLVVKEFLNTEATAYTVAKAIELIGEDGAGEGANMPAYVKGIISKVDSYNDTYHSLTYFIKDSESSTDVMKVYGGLNLNGGQFTSTDDLKVGAKVVIKGIIKKYGTDMELDKNNILVSYDYTTGINSINAELKNTPAYNISGQRVDGSHKGVVIKDGKKFMNK